MDLKRDGNLWGGVTLVVWCGAMIFFAYIYYRDSKESQAIYRNAQQKISNTFGGLTNGHYQPSPGSHLESDRAASESESDLG
jgi:hypothetical protein